jgi:hypothetical protein
VIGEPQLTIWKFGIQMDFLVGAAEGSLLQAKKVFEDVLRRDAHPIATDTGQPRLNAATQRHEPGSLSHDL